jgi:putative ABC transport system permease protein
MFEFGTTEVIVGRGASGQFVNLEVGNTIVSGQNQWQVVGVFEADGGVAESEIWADARTLQGVYRRGNSYQSMLVQLDSSDAFDMFRDWLTTNPQLNVMVRRENEYYAGQSRAMTTLIQTIGFGIAALMGIGAVFGAILTMYTAVATRAREIATLRALGFNTMSVLVSVLAESLVLGLIGGVIGGAAAYLFFNGYQTSTMNFQTFSQVAFAFLVTPQLLAMGLFYALVMGLDRRAAPGHPRRAAADCLGVTRTLNGGSSRRFFTGVHDPSHDGSSRWFCRSVIPVENPRAEPPWERPLKNLRGNGRGEPAVKNPREEPP